MKLLYENIMNQENSLSSDRIDVVAGPSIKP